MQLNTINIKKKKFKKRLGRGIGSTKGKTAGRGHKGQKSRSGVAIKSFEGGQMPLYRRLPKRGFTSFKKEKIALINLSKIEKLIQDKKIQISTKLDLSFFQKNDFINKKYKKLKILGGGDIKNKFEISANYISNSAKQKIEKQGGKVNIVE